MILLPMVQKSGRLWSLSTTFNFFQFSPNIHNFFLYLQCLWFSHTQPNIVEQAKIWSILFRNTDWKNPNHETNQIFFESKWSDMKSQLMWRARCTIFSKTVCLLRYFHNPFVILDYLPCVTKFFSNDWNWNKHYFIWSNDK